MSLCFTTLPVHFLLKIYTPKSGYSYAGLYSVVDAWEEQGKSGFRIFRFRLIYSGNNEGRKSAEEIEIDYNAKEKKRKEGTVLRIIRDTKIAHDIKKLYNYECQVCGITITTKFGRYAEGAHIRSLGKPHDGDDNSENLLCLCPNHHVMFDKGSFSILDNLNLIKNESGILNLHPKHKLNKSTLERELKEELGMIVLITDYFKTEVHQYEKFTIELIAYKCQFIDATFRMLDHDAYEWLNVKELNNRN